MSMLRLRSAEPPFADADVASQAARLLALLEALGLWQPDAVVTSLDRITFKEALESAAAAGVVGSAPLRWETNSGKAPGELAAWIRALRSVVEASPVPERELPRLDDLLGSDRLAELTGVAGSSLRRYLAGDRVVPDDVAGRAHLVARIVGDLAGSYNERGIRQWFGRPRPQLDDRAPADILRGDWNPDDPEPGRVMALAAKLTV